MTTNNNVCFYAIAKFIPDLIRNEPRNIGVILYNESNKVFKSKFNIKGKVHSSLMTAGDKIVLSHFNKFYNEFNPASKDELIESIGKTKGKIEFSEIRSVVTTDFENELDYLFGTFVEDYVEKKAIERVPNKGFKVSLKEHFEEIKVLGERKFESDKVVNGGKLNKTHKVDFAFQNGRLYIVEAVDLSGSDKRGDTFETAWKFEDLRFGLGDKVETISVVQLPTKRNGDFEQYLDILRTTSSEVYNYSNGQREAFLSRMQSIVAKT
jgi:hypothetical protein